MMLWYFYIMKIKNILKTLYKEDWKRLNYLRNYPNLIILVSIFKKITKFGKIEPEKILKITPQPQQNMIKLMMIGVCTFLKSLKIRIML